MILVCVFCEYRNNVLSLRFFYNVYTGVNGHVKHQLTLLKPIQL